MGTDHLDDNSTVQTENASPITCFGWQGVIGVTGVIGVRGKKEGTLEQDCVDTSTHHNV